MKNFQNSGQCDKNRTLGDNFWQKQGFWADVGGVKIYLGSNVWQSVRIIVYMRVIPHWFGILSFELGTGPTMEKVDKNLSTFSMIELSPCMLGYSWS